MAIEHFLSIGHCATSMDLIGVTNRKRIWHDHKAESIIENYSLKIQWDIMIQCNREIENTKQGIVLFFLKRKKTASDQIIA